MTQSTRTTLATTVLGAEVLRLHSLKGYEELSKPFRFIVTLVTKDDKPIDPAPLLGTMVKVTLDKESTASTSVEDHPKRYFNGHVTKVSRKVLPSAKWLYTVELRPWLWLLDNTRNCRIFQNQTVPEIVQKVFKDRGFTDVKLKLGNYEKREFCVQYRESDLDFVSRLLEHEGIYYYFEFDADKHTLVLADSSTTHETRPTYATIECGPHFKGVPTIETFGGRFYDWRPQHELRSKTYALKDYDFTKPLAKVEGKDDGATKVPVSPFEKFDYPGRFTEPSVGKRYATVRIQEEQVPCKMGKGKTLSHGLAPGYLFTMAKNKDPAQNVRYLTIRAKYEIAVEGYEANDELESRPWNCLFTAIEATTKFSPARVTPRPVISGLQTAKVVGKAGEEIHTDEYGRIRVQFHWDREGQSDENSSCYMRTAQMWAGPTWGSQYVPRIGQEVVVSFLEGDPDQPLVVGCVYNGLNLPPFKLPEQKELSGLKTKSTLNGGTRYNELSFEDTKDKEVINLRAQRNMRTVVKEVRYTEVGDDDTEIVKGDQYVSVTKRYALETGESSRLTCGQTSLTISPHGVTIDAPRVDIKTPIFSLNSPLAVITPAVFTRPVPTPMTVPPLPVLSTRPLPDADSVGGKRDPKSVR